MTDKRGSLSSSCFIKTIISHSFNLHQTGAGGDKWLIGENQLYKLYSFWFLNNKRHNKGLIGTKLTYGSDVPTPSHIYILYPVSDDINNDT